MNRGLSAFQDSKKLHVCGQYSMKFKFLMSKRHVAVIAFQAKVNLQVSATHAKSRLFPSQVQTRSKPRWDEFSNWSVFHRIKLQFVKCYHSTKPLSFDRTQAEMETCCSCLFSARRTWMRGPEGFRAPSLQHYSFLSQHGNNQQIHSEL